MEPGNGAETVMPGRVVSSTSRTFSSTVHPLLRAGTALALKREGFVVHAAGGAAEALALLAAHPSIAGAVLEIELGGSEADGFAIAAAARARRPDLAVCSAPHFDRTPGAT